MDVDQATSSGVLYPNAKVSLDADKKANDTISPPISQSGIAPGLFIT